MGDVVGLVEKAAEAIDEKEAMRIAERMKKSTFDFNDFLAQMKMMQKMGPLEGILGMIPGASKLKGLAGAMDDKKLKRIEGDCFVDDGKGARKTRNTQWQEKIKDRKR